MGGFGRSPSVCLYIIITVCKSQKKTPLDFDFFLAYNKDVEKKGEKIWM